MTARRQACAVAIAVGLLALPAQADDRPAATIDVGRSIFIANDVDGHIGKRDEHFSVVLAAVSAGRRELLRLHGGNEIHDSVLHAIEEELDLEELTARRALRAN